MAAVLHVHGDAAMMEELRDVKVFLFGAGGVKRQGHQLEMIFRIAEVGELGVVAFRMVRIGSRSLVRPVVELHHLTHGRGDTSSVDMASASLFIFGALAAIGEVLVPDGLAQGTHHRTGLSSLADLTALHHRIPFRYDIGRGRKVMRTHILDLLLEVAQGVGKALGHILGIEPTRGGISQDGFHTVVTRDDDESFAVMDVEHIIVGSTARCIGSH